MTPGFYLDTYALYQMIEDPQSLQQSAAAGDNGDAAHQHADDAETVDAPISDTLQQEPSYAAVGIMVFALLLCMVLFAGLMLRHLWLFYLQARLLERYSPLRRQSLLCKKIAGTIHLLGLEFRPGWQNEQTDEQLCRRLPRMQPGEYTRVAELLEKFAYSGAPLSPAEERTLIAFLNQIRKHRSFLSPITRLRLYIQFYPRVCKEI